MRLTWTKEFWPPHSPDLNPLDYFVWGEVERASNNNAHHSRKALKPIIQETTEAMDRAVVKRACGRFRSRLERMMAAEGGFIELTYSTTMLVSEINLILTICALVNRLTAFEWKNTMCLNLSIPSCILVLTMH